MLDAQTAKAMREEQKYFGINPGYKIFSPLPFSGVNQQSSRQGIDDKEFFWIENFINIGQTNLRTLWDKGTPIYIAPTGKTIIYFYSFNIGANYYFAVFLNDGTAVQVNCATFAVTTISSTANTFYNSSVSAQLPVCEQWGATYLLIANNITQNSYWVWDGTYLYTSGTLSPLITITDGGSNYTSAPTVTAYGGNGTGASFTATVLNGSVTNVSIASPGSGYEVGDEVQLAFSGGGSNTSAILTANIVGGVVQSVLITAVGSGYTAGTYALSFSGGGGGSGAAGTYTVGSAGTVVSAYISAGGSGYTSSPTVAFSSGGGSGATGISLLTNGQVGSVTVVNRGTGYTGTPTLTFEGGGGTGAAGTAVMSGNTILSVTMTNQGTGYTNAPAVIVQSGVNTAAVASVTLMPYGISGTAIEVFQSRVWITYPFQSSSSNGALQNGSVMNITAPDSFTDFSSSDGGDTFTSTDSFLRAQYVNIKQSNGYLYPIGDCSVSVISNVQTTGTANATSFNYQNTDPQIGTSWRDSVSAFSTTILFGNQFGVYGVYGGKATKISGKIDTIFNNAVFPAAGGVLPTSAIANLFAQKVFFILLTITDPFLNTARNVLLGWDEKQWFVASQSNLNLTFIGTQEINSNCVAWGTDGNGLYPLFNAASTNLTKTLSTKLFGQENFLIQKQAQGIYMQLQDLSTGATGISFKTFTIDSETGSYAIPNTISVPSCPPPYYGTISTDSGDTYGCNLGCTLTTTSKDFSLSFLGIGYIEAGSLAFNSTPISGAISTE